MKKHLLTAFLAIIVGTCCLFGATACENEQTATEGLEYQLSADGASYAVTGLGTALQETAIVIPARYQGKPVTSVAENAFQNCSSLISITIPNSVTFIGDFSFTGCEKLEELTLPKGITAIGGGSFRNCNSLTSVTIPDGVASIGYRAFADCGKLTNVTLPNSLTEIGSSAFENCVSLTSITIPDGVVMVSSSAFEGCSSLKNIAIPDSTAFIGGDAFYETAYYNDVNNWSEGVLYIGKHLISADGISGSYEIKQGTINVAVYAFWNCKLLTDITIPISVISVGNHMFYGCENLSVITFNGTQQQWNAVKKSDDWENDIVGCTIRCTDGVIKK